MAGLLRERLRTAGEGPVLEAPIATERRAIDENLARWMALPIDVGEGELMGELQRRVDRFYAVADRILATTVATEYPERQGLRTELEAAGAAAGDTLLRASRINADLARDTAQALRGVGERLLPGAVVFEAASTLAAVVAIAAAYHLSRQEASRSEQRILEQKNAELSAFSGRVAHDLLSPLMTVSLALGLAEQRLAGPADERLRTLLARAGGTLQRVRQMVADLLEFARAAARPPPGVETEVGPLLPSLAGDLEPVAAEAGVTLHVGSAAELRVPCAAGILSSVLSNLVQNAIRYAGLGSPRCVDVRAERVGQEVRFEVEDSGPGIAPADRERIFDPYVSRSGGGSGLGLGLATVKRLAESHGGRVGVCSELGHGALFWVTLPRAA